LDKPKEEEPYGYFHSTNANHTNPSMMEAITQDVLKVGSEMRISDVLSYSSMNF
jgi:hypothetical protein